MWNAFKSVFHNTFERKRQDRNNVKKRGKGQTEKNKNGKTYSGGEKKFPTAKL